MGRRRRLGRIDLQAKNYIADASPEVAEEIRDLLKRMEDADYADSVSMDMVDTTAEFGRKIVMLNNQHALVWRQYVDQPALFAVFYIGPLG